MVWPVMEVCNIVSLHGDDGRPVLKDHPPEALDGVGGRSLCEDDLPDVVV